MHARIFEYVSKDSATYAAALAHRILGTIDKLIDHPKIGRMVPEYRDPSLRELIVGNYRVVCRVRGERVGIVAIVHGSRKLLGKLPEQPWDFA